MAKMKKKWVTLCSTAIGAIYVAAYLATETQATILQPQQLAQANVQMESSQPQQQVQESVQPESSQPQQQTEDSAQPDNSQTQQPVQVKIQTKSSQTKSTQSQQPTQVKTQPASSQPQQPAQVSAQPATSQPQTSQPQRTYKDGTYIGSGSNRRGSIQVTITIKNDKISGVEISDFAMHYSESDVVGLPDEVLQIQSAQVQNVSGATYSTHAFEDAVQDALYQAKN